MRLGFIRVDGNSSEAHPRAAACTFAGEKSAPLRRESAKSAGIYLTIPSGEA
jgi:hypothetical protein